MAATPKDSKTLRAELAAAEKREQAQRDAEREARKEALRAANVQKVHTYREENYEASVGPVSDWIGVDHGFYDDSVSLTIMEWTQSQTSITLTREDALELADVLQKFFK